ncbi:MAG: hypothetical protein ACLFTG_14335 [Alphaproteobacteria bacterium]
MNDEAEWLGVGIYTASEAAALAAVDRRTVVRWLHGYRYKPAGRAEPAEAASLWTPQLPPLDGAVGAGFLDLVQLAVVGRLRRRRGFLLQSLRRALEHARDVLRFGYRSRANRFRPTDEPSSWMC